MINIAASYHPAGVTAAPAAQHCFSSFVITTVPNDGGPEAEYDKWSCFSHTDIIS